MKFTEHVERIGADGEYHYQRQKITVAIVPPSEDAPLHQAVASALDTSFNSLGDTVIYVPDDPRRTFPIETKVAIRFDDLLTKRRPVVMLCRFPKTPQGRGNRAVFAICDKLPSQEEQLTTYARGLMFRKAAPLLLVTEGQPSDSQLVPGARGAFATLEGNVGIERYHPSRDGTFHIQLARRIALVGASEMVNRREGIEYQGFTFDEWRQRLEPRAIYRSGLQLAEAGCLWDVKMEEFGDALQSAWILRTLGQAGLGEGMMSTLAYINGSTQMAISETGTSKTKIDPDKGNVVAVPGFTEQGTVHWVLTGLPEGHPISFFRHPSRESAKDMTELLVSSFFRGGLRQYLTDIKAGGSIRVDHPPSIEAFENALLYHTSALLHAGKVKSLEDLLRYFANQFAQRRILPILPGGVEACADTLIHIHIFAAKQQKDKRNKVVDMDMAGLGFPNTPPCGSFESAILAAKGLFALYELYGPQKPDELWVLRQAGHGVLVLGRRGIADVTRRTINMQFEPVPKY